MTGKDVYNVLSELRCYNLYHANSVRTSISLLRLGGLASRGTVKENGLSQTSQFTDEMDQEYGIWYDSFVDTHDIHNALRRRNFYGPVLFVLDAKLLLRLPPQVRVLVTRFNPTKWEGLPNDQRYFMTTHELEKGLRVGNSDHMITIRGINGIVPFAGSLERIILDEPRLCAPHVSHEYVVARDAILAEAKAAGICVPVDRRICNVCECTTAYQDPGKPKRIGYFYNP